MTRGGAQGLGQVDHGESCVLQYLLILEPLVLESHQEVLNRGMKGVRLGCGCSHVTGEMNSLPFMYLN